MAPPIALNVLDLSQNWDTNTPGFARYDGPTIKWVKRVAFEGVGGMEITSTLHVGTHLDAPNHFVAGKVSVDKIPLKQLFGPAVVLDVRQQVSGNPDYQLTPADITNFEQAHGPALDCQPSHSKFGTLLGTPPRPPFRFLTCSRPERKLHARLHSSLA